VASDVVSGYSLKLFKTMQVDIHCESKNVTDNLKQMFLTRGVIVLVLAENFTTTLTLMLTITLDCDWVVKFSRNVNCTRDYIVTKNPYRLS